MHFVYSQNFIVPSVGIRIITDIIKTQNNVGVSLDPKLDLKKTSE